MDMDLAFDTLAELNPEALTADGFDSACIGYVTGFGPAVAVYDRTKCIQILIDRDGMEPDDAEEFFSFNTEGAYVGEGGPIFIELWSHHLGEETPKPEGVTT